MVVCATSSAASASLCASAAHRRPATVIAVLALTFTLVVSPYVRAQSGSTEQLFKEVAPSVVVVVSKDDAGRALALGSGVKLQGDLVAANCHVVEYGVNYEVRYRGARYPADLTAGNDEQDVCLFAVPNLPAPPARIGSSTGLQVGASVFAVGAAEGLEQTFSKGIVSGLRSAGYYNYIQITAAISHGSSGGGLFDTQGRLVGLTTFSVKNGQQLNFALPIEWVTFVADGVALSRRLGVKTQNPMIEIGELKKKGDWNGLEKLARDWTRLHQKRARAWYTLGVALLNQSKYADARSMFDITLALLPDEGNDAWDVADIALYPPPDEAAVWFELALSYSLEKKYLMAIEAYHKSIERDPESAAAWFNLGLAYARSGYGRPAIDAFREAVQIDDKDADAWYNLGVAYHKSGQRSRARAVYSVLVRLDSDHAEKLLDYLAGD